MVTLTVTGELAVGEPSAATATRGADDGADDGADVGGGDSRVPVACAGRAGTSGDSGVLDGAAGGDPSGGQGGSAVPGAAAELPEATPAADGGSVPGRLTVAGAGNPAAAADSAADGADSADSAAESAVADAEVGPAGGETRAAIAGFVTGDPGAAGAVEDGGAAAAAPPTIADADGAVAAPADVADGVADGRGTGAATGARTDGAGAAGGGTAGRSVADPIVRAAGVAGGPMSLPGVTELADAAHASLPG